MDSSTVALITASIVGITTLGASGIAAWASVVSNKRTKTNHGKTIGEHVESIAMEAKDAKEAAQFTALQLAQYKDAQAAAAKAIQATLEEHTQSDTENFTELRDLIAGS